MSKNNVARQSVAIILRDNEFYMAAPRREGAENEVELLRPGSKHRWRIVEGVVEYEYTNKHTGAQISKRNKPR